MDEFADFLNDAIGALVFGRAGLRSEHERWAVVLDESIVGKTSVIHGHAHAGQEPVAIQVWQLDELQERLSPGGSIAQFMGDQWLVAVYQQWEEVLRPKAAMELGIETCEVKVPILGDLRRLRNDVVHHRGLASRDKTGKCEILRHWFAEGERIIIDPEKVREFQEQFFSSQDYSFSRLSEEALRNEYAEYRRRLREALAAQPESDAE